MTIERVEQQWREIDELNKTVLPFKVYKSIESDILNDGSLDYPDEILGGFDIVCQYPLQSQNGRGQGYSPTDQGNRE